MSERRRRIQEEKAAYWHSEASRVFDELHADGKDKSLFMIVNDDKKRIDEISPISNVARDKQFDVVVASQTTGEDAIAFFEAFRKHEGDKYATPTCVVVFMDGNLGASEEFGLGSQVARHMMQQCERNGWEKPFLVGASTSWEMNKMLGERFPAQTLSAPDNAQLVDRIIAKVSEIDSLTLKSIS